MSDWKNKPLAIEVKAGDKISFCACGLSKNAPYCDGSHKQTDIQPYRVTFEEDKKIWACCCKHSHKRPFCDGTHKTLKGDVVCDTAGKVVGT